jgi:hypothetical protein
VATEESSLWAILVKKVLDEAKRIEGKILVIQGLLLLLKEREFQYCPKIGFQASRHRGVGQASYGRQYFIFPYLR